MTVWLFLVLLECSLAQLSDAESAHKVLWMELVPHGSDTASGDGLVTSSTQRSSVLVVVYFTVRPSLVLVVCSSTKPIPAFKAHKALNMPLFLKSSDTIVDNCLTTSPALGGKLLIIIFTAVGLALKHMVLCTRKGTVAVHTHKVLRMPSLLHCCRTFV